MIYKSKIKLVKKDSAKRDNFFLIHIQEIIAVNKNFLENFLKI